MDPLSMVSQSQARQGLGQGVPQHHCFWSAALPHYDCFISLQAASHQRQLLSKNQCTLLSQQAQAPHHRARSAPPQHQT
jgi:hypothetical protein